MPFESVRPSNEPAARRDMSAEPTTADGDLEQMQRLHPLTLVHRFVVSLPALLVALLPAIRNPDANAWFYIGALLLYGIFVIPFIIVQYVRFRYAVTRKEIIIHRGVFTYRHRNIPIDRIQNIEIEQRLMPRMLGTAKVKIETAGSTSTEGVIEYVSLQKARAIRSTVRAYQRARTESTASSGAESPATESARTRQATAPPVTADSREAASERAAPAVERDAVRLLHEMPVERVLLSGVFRFSLLYIVVIFSATEYLGLTPEEIARWFTGDRFEAFTLAMETSPILVIGATVLMVTVLAWITGILTNFNRFYGFRLGLEGDKLHTRQGFLTVSEGTIPLKKVQALVIRSNPLMAAFGWYRLELQTMGFDPDDRGYRVAVPFARRDEIMQVAHTIRPIDEPAELAAVSRLMIRRTFVRYAAVLIVLAIGASYFWTYALWGFAALPVLLFLAFQQYRQHGYYRTPDYFFVRRGVFRRSLWIMPVERFQVFYLTQSLFQKRLGLQSLYVDTPGAGAMAHPVVVDLPAPGASDLLLRLYRSLQSKLESRRESS